MNDEETGRMLERLADRVPVGPAPVDDLVRAGKSAQRRKRHMRVFGAAAAMTLVLSGSVVAQAFIGEGTPSVNDSAKGPFVTPSSPAPETDLDNPTSELSGPLPDGGRASCVEGYTPEAIANRAFAFDGVVVDIGPAHSNRSGKGYLDLVGVTFAVREWFSGGTGPNITVDMGSPTAGTQDVTAEVFHSYAIGSRLLVSGEPRWGGSPLDAPIAWGCGFTRYYDQQTAGSWRRAATTEKSSEPTSRPTRSNALSR
ncbi:hypothetical protein GCM10020358_21730 [Amorphoplanes nipponensis]|uniref:Uncharacterized protein n=1 Tax=Actinoplanes nipponensis TaxID=135950 RepID=A0A919MN10_9ACTN|nr:hypothetical protein [Actinoplanes nipponensis]GIE47988.1 hypothetical protein Ani05nite_15220 [Actinoplanes nipponensis]